MNLEKQFYQFIEQLNQNNQYRNIFYEEDSLVLGDLAIEYILNHQEELHEYSQALSNHQLDEFIKNISVKSCEELIKILIKINQYLEITEKLRVELIQHYQEFNRKLISDILHNQLSENGLYQDVYTHQLKLRSILQEYDELSLFHDQLKWIEPVPNFEYTPELQIQLMRIDLHEIKEPILDIGCGEHANLVRFLSNLGLDVFGIDRQVLKSNSTLNTSWFDFDFGNDKFGTIISHQSFANHFRRQHFKDQGKIIEYSKLYVKILNSLQINGSFYYTPDLPFIERFLNPKHYQVIKYPINNSHFNTVQIIKLI